jgi:8-amino-7-oxononanoate synthase
MQEEFLHKKINERREQGAYRQLRLSEGKVDFCSNDYLGIAKNQLIEQAFPQHVKHGSTGSRLLSGNYPLIAEAEKQVAVFHDAVSALVFNSGYDANLGLLSCVPQRGDTIVYDRLCHASIRDGIRLSFAEAFSFLHNDLDDLENKLQKAKGNIFVVTESVFSMDGDMAPLAQITVLCERFGAQLIVDEAHATGVIGKEGEGLVQQLGLQKKCFARVHTFGKAVGCHGAVVLGSSDLRNYLIDFSRPFIYTTALPESSLAAIRIAYNIFPKLKTEREQLQQLILQFQNATMREPPIQGEVHALKSETPVQAVIVPGNDEVKRLSLRLADSGLDVRPILYPTVPRGGERLRVVLHSYNTSEELTRLIDLLVP